MIFTFEHFVLFLCRQKRPFFVVLYGEQYGQEILLRCSPKWGKTEVEEISRQRWVFHKTSKSSDFSK